MNKVLGRFKGTLMLILLMLIATRLTWLQISETSTDLSSSFYRTGLWVNEFAPRLCKEAPEATFPLPPAMAIRPDSQPPPPSLGELSPGLGLVMIVRCQWARLEADDLAHWNAWLFMAAALFSSIAVRLLTHSWTAGLLAAVAVLSRGTLQNRAMLAASEPYAAPFIAAAWCFALAFFRSLWWPWIVALFLAWITATAFVPALWPSLILLSAFAFVCIRVHSPATQPWKARFLNRASYTSLSETRPPRFWVAVGVCGLFSALASAWAMTTFMAGSVPAASIIKSLFDGTLAWSAVVRSLKTLPELTGMHAPDIDWHAWLTVILVLILPWTGGRFAPANRAAGVLFLSVTGLQIFLSIWQECLVINTATLAHPVIVPAARAIEPIFIAWGTASAWRIVDVFTGYRLSSSGWSIRGRDRMEPNN